MEPLGRHENRGKGDETEGRIEEKNGKDEGWRRDGEHERRGRG